MVVHGTDNSEKHLDRHFSLHHIDLRAHELYIASDVALPGIDLIRADVVWPFFPFRTRGRRRVILVARKGHLDPRECTFPSLCVVDRVPIFDLHGERRGVAFLCATFRIIEKFPDEYMRIDRL